MVANVNEFVARLAKHGGVMRQTLAVVNVTPPASITDSIVTDIPWLCESQSLPGFVFHTDTYQHKGYGMEERRAYGMAAEDLQFTFISDSNGKMMKFFDNWCNKVFNMHGENGDHGTERLGYPAEYYGTIEIYVYNSAMQKVMTFTLENAYPVNVGNVSMGWSMNDQYVMLPVTFTYRNHYMKLSDASDGYNTTAISNQTNLTNRNIAAVNMTRNIPTASQQTLRLNSIEV